MTLSPQTTSRTSTVWRRSPCALYSTMVLYVWRVSSAGDLRLEAIVGERVGPSDRKVRSAHTLVHRGHMRLLVPPADFSHATWLKVCQDQGLTPLQTLCSGWAHALLQADPAATSVPGDAVSKCQRCRAAQQEKGSGVKVGRCPDNPK